MTNIKCKCGNELLSVIHDPDNKRMRLRCRPCGREWWEQYGAKNSKKGRNQNVMSR
jgi:hypothetical protein